MRLVERGELLTRLEEYLDEAETGGRVALIGGEAGAGKTSLAVRFVETCPDSFRVLSGGCDPLSTPRPLAPFRDMAPFAPLLEDRRGRHGLLTALLNELSLPTVMVVEDAHWADEATLDALRFIGRRATATRSVVLVTYRDDEIGADHPLRAVLGDLSTATGCERLHIPRLTADGVRTLAAGSAVDAARLHSITGGNAFYVTEVLAAPGWTVPLSVTDAVLARASRLSANARRLVDLVSIAPEGLEIELAEHLVEGAGTALDDAIESGVLVLAGGRLTFRHELARLALEGAVAAGRRRELQARLLDLLQRRPGVDAARLAHHAEAAGDAARVLEYAPAAAREASVRGAHREAARHLERTLAYADDLPESELADLLSFLAEERIGFDDPTDRVRLLERIVALRRGCGDAMGAGAALALLSRTIWSMGRPREAAKRVGEAIALLEPLPHGPELAAAYAARSFVALTARDGRKAILWGERAIELGERVGAKSALRTALNFVGSAKLTTFEDLGGIDDLEHAVRMAAEDGDDFDVGRALGNLGASLGEIRRYDQAAAYLEQAVSFDDEHDLDGLAAHARAELAKVRFEQGHWGEAERIVDEALQRRDVAVGVAVMALMVRGRLDARRGAEQAASLLDEAWMLCRDTGDLQWTWPVAAGRAELAWLTGRAAEIPAIVEPIYEQATSFGDGWVIGELGSWLLRTGFLERLPDDAAEPYRLPWREAAEAWRRIGCPYEQAEALGEGDEAAMREALAIFVRLGAEPAADVVRARMRRAGVTAVPARPRASTRRAPAQLTRRQLEVLALVESGLSNAEIARKLFISEKTAGHHVSAILRKLDARSRGEAAAAARKIGIPATET